MLISLLRPKWWSIALLAVVLNACATTPPPQAPKAIEKVPSAAALELPALKSGESVEQRHGFSFVFNSEKRIAKWVAYALDPEKASPVLKRRDRWHTDPSVPGSPNPKSFSRTGYQRGHLAPSADMRWSAEAMDDSCFMTNVAGQSPHLNNGMWKKLEERVREHARTAEHVYVATGPVLTEPCVEFVDRNICIAKRFYKAVLEERDHTFTAIAFVIPQDYESKELASYAMTVNDAETLTGIDFFPTLPDEVESQKDLSAWAP